MDHRKELIQGAQESLKRDKARLDYHNKTGYYTPEDAAMFTRDIEHAKARIEKLQTCSQEELIADLSRT